MSLSRSFFLSLSSTSLLAFALAAGCSAEPRGSGFGQDLPAEAGGGGGGIGGEDGGGGFLTGEGGTQLPQSRIRGQVYAPNGSLPMSGVLVYVTTKEPDPIPAGTYCDKCVELEEGSFTYSKADGSIDFMPRGEGERFLVVQKGQFRKVRKIQMVPGETSVPAEAFVLPKTTDAAKGDTVPKMLVLHGFAEYDMIEESLTKLGIEATVTDRKAEVLADFERLKQYHVVFIPCDDEAEPSMSDPAVQANLRQYVDGGGKLYVTDYSYEYVRQPFGGRIQWQGENATIGSATDSALQWDAPATAVDADLGAWLSANGHPSFEIEANYVKISAVNTLPGKDETGADVMITPKVWVTGKVSNRDLPSTVSFQSTCGRVLFSTYHTEAAGPNSPLLAQEKALLHILLEVGVCVGKPPGGPK